MEAAERRRGERRGGRPPVKPGERSVPVTVAIEESLRTFLEEDAAKRRTDLPDLLRAVLRQYRSFREKTCQGPSHAPS